MPETVEVKPFLLRGFRGLNSGVVPQNIEDGQFQVLENWYPFHGVLYRRKGLDRISGTAYGQALSTLFAYKISASSWKCVGGSTDALVLLNDDEEVVAIQEAPGVTITSSALPWSMKQYKNIFYACRSGSGGLLRSDGNSVAAAGIAAPTTAPTLAEGAAGDLGAGDYVGVYTYYNSNTGSESDYSPASTALTLAASKKIDWSAVTTSSNGQVNARRLYRTLVDQQGEYFRVATINDNVNTTTYTGDNALLADMGAAAGTKNGTPPTTCLYCEIFQERMWVTDGVDLYFSELGLPESFGAFNYIPVSPDDGYSISGLKAFSERLLIGKTNALYYLTGTDDMSFELRTLSDRHGVASHHSMKASEGICFWFGGNNFYMTDGNSVQAIGNTEIRDIVDAIPADAYKNVVAGVDSKYGWYVVGIPYGDVGYINKILVFNYRSGDWTTFTYDTSIGCPQYFGEFEDEDGLQVIYCPTYNSTGHVYQFMEGEDDYGYDIVCVLRTKSFGFGRDDTLKFMKDLQFLISTSSAAEDIVAELYVDDETSNDDTFTVNTYGNHLWKRIALANNDNLGNFMDVKLTYTGNADFKLSGLGFTVVDTGRQSLVLR